VAERKRRGKSEPTIERGDASSFLSQFPSLPVSLLPNSRLVAIGEEESLGAEKFRFLAVRLRQLRQSRTMKKVLITSTIPQEGKSTVAANLACTLARRKQHKTLLLEGDLRRPTVAQKFGMGNVPGLSEQRRLKALVQVHFDELAAVHVGVGLHGTHQRAHALGRLR
jgi:Mrp family chromosome partitioning ATPase